MAYRKDKMTKPLNLAQWEAWSRVPAGDRKKVKKEVAEFVKDSIFDAVGSAKSPVSGGRYKSSLSKGYLKEKRKYSSSLIANMELTGDMLDSMTWKDLGGSSLEVGFFDPQEAAKAHGHNTGWGPLPERKFIPRAGEKFKRDIQSGIAEIIKEHATQEPRKKPERIEVQPDTLEVTATPAATGLTALDFLFGDISG